MFTGLIEELGTIRRIDRAENAARLCIGCRTVLDDCRVGDSIAVNGACLTVVGFGAQSFDAQASSETLACTTLGNLRPGNAVNLERALRLGDRLGGHLVTGHVDGLGTVTGIVHEGGFVRISFSAPKQVARYLVEKGSIAVDGISLTVAGVHGAGFSVMLIPHTLDATTLHRGRVGDSVNLEADIIGKYVEKLTAGALGGQKGQGLTEETLAKFGFIR